MCVPDGKENTATPTYNTILVSPYFNNNYYSAANMPEEDYMEHNINALRLRDITLSYTLPSKALVRNANHMDAPGILDYATFKTVSFFMTCNDLVLFTNYTGADPAANGGNASLRGVGAVGFDYGNIAAPLSFNLGVRVGF